MSDRRQSIQIEQLYVVGMNLDTRCFLIGGESHPVIPWHFFSSCHLYALDQSTLDAMLLDAAIHGYQIVDGSVSDRRGMSGFKVCIGPHGVDGLVSCRQIDAWVMDDLPGSVDLRTGTLQENLRKLCDLLNGEQVGFKPTAINLLSSAYSLYGKPSEPEGVFPAPLPERVAMLGRRAHVGGPLVHARTSLEPYVRLDRVRAYGEAMLGDMPVADPIQLSDPHQHWTTGRLQRQMGLVDATVRVHMGPCVTLLPVMRWSESFDRTRSMYPTGIFRGAFVVEELAAMEEAGAGEVERVWEAWIFGRGRPLAPVVQWLRRMEPTVGKLVVAKRLEHILYGTQSRSLSFRTFGSVPSYREPVLQDILDSQTLERIKTRVSLFRMPFKSHPSLPLYEVRGFYSARSPYGMIDRPDRSAHITARNRIEVWKMIRWLDKKLESPRSGQFVGRIYVDGIDIEATPEQVGVPPKGWQLREHGSKMEIYRAGVFSSVRSDGVEEVEDGGMLLDEKPSREKLLRLIKYSADADGGPLASGRYWPKSTSRETSDPRLLPNVFSEPIDFAEGAFDGWRE